MKYRFSRPHVSLRVLIPNIITLMALAAGATAIRITFEGSQELAVMAIAAAAILDGLDGRIARALKGTSRFGAELDSLADFIDFGVAPGILLYFSGLSALHDFGWLVCLIFMIACALRLARFNVTAEHLELQQWRKGFFVGMPAPAGAVLGLLPVYIHILTGAMSRSLAVLASFYVLAVAILMVSQIPHFSGKSIGKIPRQYVAVSLIGVASSLLFMVYFPLLALVGLALFYLITIPFAYSRFQQLERENREASTG